jgi:hypothetical protein
VDDLIHLSEHSKKCRANWKPDMVALIFRLIDNNWLKVKLALVFYSAVCVYNNMICVRVTEYGQGLR